MEHNMFPYELKSSGTAFTAFFRSISFGLVLRRNFILFFTLYVIVFVCFILLEKYICILLNWFISYLYVERLANHLMLFSISPLVERGESNRPLLEIRERQPYKKWKCKSIVLIRYYTYTSSLLSPTCSFLPCQFLAWSIYMKYTYIHCD